MKIPSWAALMLAFLPLAAGAAPAGGPEEEKALRRAAERGDARAEYEFGRLIARGGDPGGRAAHWYRLAAAQGAAAAKQALADLQAWRGPGPRKGRAALERARACAAARGEADPDCASLLVAAANEGNAQAQCGVAKARLEAAEASDFYDSVHDVKRGEPSRERAAVIEAVGWLRASAEQGWPEAQYLLGRLLERGVYVGKDAKAAAGWYRRAADQGHARAWEALDRIAPP